MEYERFDEIEFEDGKKYVVIDTVNLKGNLYLYIINEDIKQEDIAIVKVNKMGEDTYFKNIENEEEFNEVLQILTSQNKKFVDELMETSE